MVKTNNWQSDFLKKLSIKQYGRSYDDKFNSAVKTMGGNADDARGFRNFLDTMNMQKSKRVTKPKQGSTLEQWDKESDREAAVRKAKAEKEKKQREEQQKKQKAALEKTQAYSRFNLSMNKPKSSGLFDDIKAAGKAAYHGFNPFDSVSMEDAVKGYLNRNTSKAFDEIARGANRTVDSASFGMMSNLDKKVNNRDPYYLSNREFGKGGGTDMLTTGLGYLVPGTGLYKGLNATKAGMSLTNFGSKGIAQRLLSEAAKGGMIGASQSGTEVGVKELLNPKDQNWKDNAKYIGTNTALGAIADPLIYGAGKGLSKGMETAASKSMKKLMPEESQIQKALTELTKEKPKSETTLDVLDESTIDPEIINLLKQDKPLFMSLKNLGKQTDAAIEPKVTEQAPIVPNQKIPIDTVTNDIKQPIKGTTNLEATGNVKQTGGKSVSLKSVQTNKGIDSMSKEELQSVYKQLNDEFQTLSKGKKKTTRQRIQDVQADLETVKNQLLKLDLQAFGEVGKIPSELLPDTKSHIGTKTEKTNVGIKEAVNTGYIKTVDNLHRLNQFDKQVEEVLGRKLKASESTHTLGLNSRGTDMISKQILTENMVDKNGEVIGSSLKDITMKVPKGKLKDFEDYLINRHAITRMERGEKVFPDDMQMTPDTSRAIVRNYEESHPEFKDIAKEYYEYNKQLGQKWLVDTGILSKDQWEGYLKANPNYVPNNRIFSDLERPKFMGNAKKGFANQSNPVKKATGSQRKIVSPIESTIEHTAQYVKVAKRNEVMQTLINNIKQNPEAFKDWAEIVPTDKTPKSIMDTLEKEGIDGVLDEFNKGFDQKPDLTKGNILRGLIDGHPVHVKVHDPALLDALTNLQPKAQNVVINAMGQVTRVMKNLTTGINPVFSLTRNIWRDIPTAFANSKSTNNPFVFSKDLVQSVISVFKNDELYQSFKAVGGGHSSPISSDVNLLAQSKRSILPKEKGVWNGTKHVGGKLLGALENLNNAVEAAPRLGEFKRLSGNDYDSKMKALYEANDVTVNFNKYGNVSKEVDAVIPYFNAAVQGLDKTRRMFMEGTKAERATAAAKAFSAITIPSILMYTINHDDPNYQKVSNYIKDTNILIPKGDGTFIKIPKPRELGVIFGSDVERVLRAWADQDPEAFKDFGTTIWDNFKPPVRTIAAPFFDIRANKNFMDAPIVPGDLQGLSPQYQYDSRTSELSKKLGMLFKASPKNIDYIIQSYTGGVGELGLPMLTKNTTVGQTLKQKVTVDPVFSNDIQRDFYNTKTKLDQAHNDLAKQGVKTKDLNEELRKIFGKKSREMGDVRKDMKEIQNDPSMSAVERLKKLRELQEKINQIAESGNKLAR